MCLSFTVAVHLALLLYKTMTSHWAFCQGRGRAQAAALRSRFRGARAAAAFAAQGRRKGNELGGRVFAAGMGL